MLCIAGYASRPRRSHDEIDVATARERGYAEPIPADKPREAACKPRTIDGKVIEREKVGFAGYPSHG